MYEYIYGFNCIYILYSDLRGAPPRVPRGVVSVVCYPRSGAGGRATPGRQTGRSPSQARQGRQEQEGPVQEDRLQGNKQTHTYIIYYFITSGRQ